MSHRDDEDFDDDELPPTGTFEHNGASLYRPTQTNLFGNLEPTFEEMVLHYFAHVELVGAADQTRKNDRSHIRAALRWLSEQGIPRPKTLDWKRYFDWRISPACPDRITTSTVEDHRAAIRKLYIRCTRLPKEGWFLIQNPVTTDQIPPYYEQHRDRRRPRSMGTPEETFPLIQAAMPDPVALALVKTLYNQGFRIQEAIAIPLPGGELEKRYNQRWLRLEEATLMIEFQRSRDRSGFSKLKTGYSKALVRLVGPTVKAIREALLYRKEQALRPKKSSREGVGVVAASYVFPYFRKELDELMGIHRLVAPKDFARAIKGEQGGNAWHVYRHTWATRLARSGIDRRKIHEALRHRDWGATDAYLSALLVDVRGDGDEFEEAARQSEERQAQAVEERSGKGLILVKKGEDKK